MSGAVCRDRSEVADSLFFKVSDKPVDRILEMADRSLRQGAQGDALSLYLIVCARQPETLDSAAVANRVRAYVGAGDIMMRRCDYAVALDNYIQALIASEASLSQPMGAVIYKNIGNVYCCLNEYETGVDYYKKGLRICEAHPDNDVEKKLLTNLSGMTTYTGDTIEAEQYLAMSRRVYPPKTDEEIWARFFDIRDSIMDDREFNAVKNVLFQYKVAKTADEIQSLYKDKDEKESIIRRQRMILLSVVAGAFGYRQ